MLLLARRLNESFRIGDVLVKVVGFRGRQVVLGIEAPREVDIVRGELEGVNKRVNEPVNESVNKPVNKRVNRVFTEGEDEVHGI